MIYLIFLIMNFLIENLELGTYFEIFCSSGCISGSTTRSTADVRATSSSSSAATTTRNGKPHKLVRTSERRWIACRSARERPLHDTARCRNCWRECARTHRSSTISARTTGSSTSTSKTRKVRSVCLSGVEIEEFSPLIFLFVFRLRFCSLSVMHCRWDFSPVFVFVSLILLPNFCCTAPWINLRDYFGFLVLSYETLRAARDLFFLSYICDFILSLYNDLIFSFCHFAFDFVTNYFMWMHWRISQSIKRSIGTEPRWALREPRACGCK